MSHSPIAPSYFSLLLPELATRAARATVNRLGFSNPALRQYLSERFSVGLGEPGCFVGTPVFEATFGWHPAQQTLTSLSPGLLTPRLLDALDAPAGDHGSSYRFARNAKPYRHQLEAWEILSRSQPQSVIVTSGTGSGKTECFMVPILNQLARETELNPGAIEGVRALFLYPLNALIQSQQERLHAWTGPFGGSIRFCLYNGQTEEKPGPSHLTNKRPNQVLDRQTLRASPPPILVTNATMLEYMLVRSQDAPILEKSKGKLQWIVLDEAHSYIGSQAAELSLLLRRVLHGFGVDSNDVRFIATSATIGDPKGEAGQKLKDFLAGLAGVGPERVHVVAGERHVPELSAGNAGYRDSTLDELESISLDDASILYQALCANSTAVEIRSLFVPRLGGKAARTLDDVCNVLVGQQAHHSPLTKQIALRWLDLLTRSLQAQGNEVVPYLPLRLHAFHNVMAGLWACSDQHCRCRHGTALDSPNWAFGAVYTEERQTCECGAPVYELRSCNDCNETYLWGRLAVDSQHGKIKLIQDIEEMTDEFQLDSAQQDDAEAVNDDGTSEQEAEKDRDSQDTPLVLIANRHQVGTDERTIDIGSRIFDSPSDLPNVTVRIREMHEGQLTCPECGGHHGQGKQMFRPARFGAPFLLMQVIPTLLEFCPDGSDALNKPLRGRRMITFTDSRQGTARMAAALQRDAERNALRSAVYRFLANRSNISTNSSFIELQDEIKDLEDAVAAGSTGLAQLLDRKKIKLSQFKPKPVSFEDLAKQISMHEMDVWKWALSYYREINPIQFEGDSGALELSRLFLFREFSRRPKRGNNLEALGLVAVQYPKLDRVNVVPAAVLSHTQVSIEEWHHTLKLTLDFVVREMSCLEFSRDWQKWIGKKTVSAKFLPPDSKDKAAGIYRRWPQTNKVGQQNRMVRLLAAAFQKDPDSAPGRDAIDSILRAIWDELVRLELLRKAADGRYLALEDLSFDLIGPAWTCPVTRRVLDVTLRGLTPYLPGHKRKASTIECTRIQIPKWPSLGDDFSSPEVRVESARTWLSHDPTVNMLREQGIWSNVNDRMIEGVRYYRTAEHSAQQSGPVLQDYEDRFKQGTINLLSCSTTMEMGVDIGGISVVAMNNVPPHPANYLQRAGRAGRRSETRSIALTVCKNNPHDQMVFGNPAWPFTTQLPAPVIKLESPVIVQRHLNAMWLSNFLWLQMDKASGKGELNKLNMAWWALPKGASKADEFLAKLRCFDLQQDARLTSGLRMLLRNTCFDSGVPLTTLAAESAVMMEAILDGWYGEFFAIKAQLSTFDEQKQSKEPAFRALSIQVKRLTDEYLLRELASGGFLPGYGFPTNVTSFDTLNMELLDRQKRQKDQEREDNRLLRRDLPSRDAVTALREYAPGSDVVIDGQVYRSAGVTLNWHAPASADVKQIQSIRQAWRCHHCGASGTEITRDGHDRCSACGEPLTDTERFTYLEPAGFAVDLYATAHTDVSSQSFVPVNKPWVNAEGTWQTLPNPVLGRFRSSPTGRVFNHSSGANGTGYAVCLECGRAEPMPSHVDAKDKSGLGHLPALFRKPHKRLRGGKGASETTSECQGSHKSFAIKPNLHLGLEMVTDVLELQLNGLDGLPIADHRAAYSIAVALRSALASTLGVEIDEIGCDTKPIRHPMQQQVGYVIVLSDRAAAGYCSSVSERLPELLDLARAILLNCPGGCESACQHCLLDYDTRFRLGDLDRFAATEFLSEAWMQQLRLQIEDQLFGQALSQAETLQLPEAITREWAKSPKAELRLFCQGNPTDWDFAAPSLKRHLLRWSERGLVRLLLPSSSLEKLSTEQQDAIGQLCSWGNLSVHRADHPIGDLLAELADATGCMAWRSRDCSVGTPADEWGKMGTAVLVRARLQESSDIGVEVEYQSTPPVETSNTAGRLDIKSQLDGRVDGFGKKLLARLGDSVKGKLLGGEADITTVIYRDRYLNSPLPAALLVDFIGAIKDVNLSRWDNPTIEIVSVAVPEDARGFAQPTQVFHNWPSTQDRDAAIKAAFELRGMNAVVRNLLKSQASHARTLEVGMSDGRKLKLWFDQGFGYWTSPRQGTRSAQAVSTWFGFKELPSWQGEELFKGRYAIEGQSFATHVFYETV
jgi:DEAD/DEAH box helicase domain-containing protein